MRICPKCGHLDPECWRPAAFHPEISYAYIDSLEVFSPEIVEQLKDKKPGEIIVVDPFVYWKSPRSPTVRRTWIEDYKIKGKSVNQERVSHNPQTTLDNSQLEDNSINLLYVNHPKVASICEKSEVET